MTKILEQLFAVLRCSILNDIKLELALFLQSLRYQNRDRRIQRRGIAASALKVTLLTGLRTGEVIGARWTEIDLQRKTWVIPPERHKDRKTGPNRIESRCRHR
jgi:integrase